ncbi:MAG: Rieske 2Fe-2S domain-containing protein [Candidatus Latescibacteria bacterium]|nr:Rieske 2Fe-2S domain-containing protein [Candidatus Latescibacterota bacterium]
MAREPQWIKAAPSNSVAPGEARAIRIGETRSIALFNVDGTFYATDNQCPHMGYPLTRGVVRHGVLTCDWHGRSFDLEGGGCFNRECDDLETFAVEVRDEEIWILVPPGGYRRREEHMRLLWEGLLSGDRWTLSKAIALLLKGGVPQDDIVELILRHLGRHIASSHGADGSDDVARLLNGLKVGRRYSGEDRLILLTTAASAAAGGAAERLEVVPLPGEVAWADIERWIRMFSRDHQAGRIERCLFSAHQQGYQDNILQLLIECSVAPYFTGFSDHIIALGYLAEVVEEFGWDGAGELVFYLGAQLVGRGRGEPERFRRDAIGLMNEMEPIFTQAGGTGKDYDEDGLVAALLSADLERSFQTLGQLIQAGTDIERLIDTFVLLAADRMARTPVNVDAGWPCLSREFHLAASLRTVHRYGGAEAGARALGVSNKKVVP